MFSDREGMENPQCGSPRHQGHSMKAGRLHQSKSLQSVLRLRECVRMAGAPGDESQATAALSSHSPVGQGHSAEHGVEREWKELCGGLGVSDECCTRWWGIIRDHYGEGWRHYHTLTHIWDMLGHLSACRQQLRNADEVALAIFFHDVIYEPKASDNEEQSALGFQDFASEGLGKDGRVNSQQVVDMILQTKSHRTEAHTSESSFGNSDEHYLLDFDMAILGEEESVYDRYAANIRREYCHIPLPVYCQKRAQVLSTFLSLPKIYSTKEFNTKSEHKARANIEREIEALDGIEHGSFAE